MGLFPVNPMLLIGLIMQGQNPVLLLLSIINLNMQNSSPMYNNLTSLTMNLDARGLEQFARNLAASKGLDFDKEFSDFKRNLGM